MRYLPLALLLSLSLVWISTPAASWPQLILIPVTKGLNRPVHITHAGDGSQRLFVVEQTGRIRIINKNQLLNSPFLEITDRVGCCGERGLLSVAFPPNFANKHYYYVNYTNKAGDTVIARFHLSANDPNQTNPNSEDILLTVVQPFSNHNGGQLAFGPDGLLYIGMGDGGSGGDPQGHGQNPNSLLGKMLRIEVESGTKPYAIPTDNPFKSNPAYRDEIWALGLRNPWRFAFDRNAGDLYIADVGQDDFEEVNVQSVNSKGGENYGWNIMEGQHCYNAPQCDNSQLTKPVMEYDHSQGDRSITGGNVYRGMVFPQMQGVYFYADYVSGRLWGLRRRGNHWENQLLLETGHSISTFGEDEAGNLYLADLTKGEIYRIESKIRNTRLNFEGLQSQYVIGDHLAVSLREQPPLRITPLDLWVAIQFPHNDTLLYLTGNHPVQLNSQSQPFKSHVEVSEINHILMTLTIPPHLGEGIYTFYAIYNELATDLSDLTLTRRSDIAVAQTQLHKG